jgi:hypothetical protein
MDGIMNDKKGEEKERRNRRTLPYYMAAALVHGLGHLPHEPQAASSVHQVHLPRHLIDRQSHQRQVVRWRSKALDRELIATTA